jgi:2-polyprenyl-6-methoxyphenol hydroxylase-like FAD-dependent oxidoreductase
VDAAQLQAVAHRTLEHCHPNLLRLVELSDLATVSSTRIRTSRAVPRWVPSQVTLVGDAIHSMTPFRGIGANVALRDASLLSQELIAMHRGERPLLEAVGRYEEAMREYGFAAVRASLSSMVQSTSNRPIRRRLMKMVLRSINKRPRWKQWVADSYARAPR